MPMLNAWEAAYAVFDVSLMKARKSYKKKKTNKLNAESVLLISLNVILTTSVTVA